METLSDYQAMSTLSLLILLVVSSCSHWRFNLAKLTIYSNRSHLRTVFFCSVRQPRELFSGKRGLKSLLSVPPTCQVYWLWVGK